MPLFDRVVVTGPHRSGTTIATEILATEWNLVPIRESEIAHPRFEGDDEPDLAVDDVRQLLNERTGFVLQGATTFQWLHRLSFDLVVFMLRNKRDILNSQQRYRGRILDSPERKLRQMQNMNLPRVMYLEYESLRNHPLFHVNRKNWAPRQTR